jgi:hypothetical protein
MLYSDIVKMKEGTADVCLVEFSLYLGDLDIY